MIYMRGMKSHDLLAIFNFLYYEEVNIYQDNLDIFLNIAEELQLKELIGEEGGSFEEGDWKEIVGMEVVGTKVVEKEQEMLKIPAIKITSPLFQVLVHSGRIAQLSTKNHQRMI